MIRVLCVVALGMACGGCTIVRINNDDTTTIEHRAGAGQELANKACRRAGQQVAVIVSTANKNPVLPQGTGTQISTFRCSSS